MMMNRYDARPTVNLRAIATKPAEADLSGRILSKELSDARVSHLFEKEKSVAEILGAV